jgi:integrase
MAHKPFNLYKRPTTKKNKYIYYVQFYDTSNKRLTAITTGQTTKSAAENWAYEQLKKDLIVIKRNLSFSQYAKDWWLWDKCKYIKSKLMRGSAISRSYADTMRYNLVEYILPYFGGVKLIKITPNVIENWLMKLTQKTGKFGKPLSPTSVNRCYTTLKIMLREAIRLGHLNSDPSYFISPLKEKPKEKEILSVDEVKELFREEVINKIWDGDLFQFTMNLLAASSGMRLGEIQALQIKYTRESYISVVLNWDRKYGFKAPKRNSQREVPIPSKTSSYLKELISISPYKEPDDFVFWGIDRKTPIYYKKIRETLYRAYKNIGISEEERNKRNLSFHSWRHFYNSLMRGKIPDVKLRRLTGHRSEKMSDLYTHFHINDFQDVLRIQERFFS